MTGKTVDKLAKICAMLSSPHDGERASAALLATQIISDLDLTWNEVVHRAFQERGEVKSVEFDERPPGWHVGYCRWLISNRGNVLNKWQMQFLNDLVQRYGHARLTKKQVACLSRTATEHGLEIEV